MAFPVSVSTPRRAARLSLIAAVAWILPAAAQPLLDVSLAGTVTDPSGKPVAGAVVSLLSRGLSASTDAAGHYTLQSASSSLRAPVARAYAGATNPYGKFPWRDGARDANGRNLHVSPFPAASRALVPVPKSAAAGDTLDVLAVGWQREDRAVASLSGAQDFKLKALAYNAVPYRTGNLDAYTKQMCTLDVHVPTGTPRKWPVIVHLHGGGLQEGDSQEGWSAGNMNNAIRRIWEQGYLLICPNYRLGIDPDLPNGGAPRGKYPDYLRDAAAAVSWARRNAPAYGGDTANFYVMGYSAGAWLSLMLAIDTTWYHEAGFKGKNVNGYVCLSAQTYTYGEYGIEFKISDRGISPGAAMNYVHKMDTPIRLFAGGLETQRIADDNDFMKAMNAVGTTNLDFLVMPGRDHQHIISSIGDANDETRAKILEFLNKFASKK